MNNQKNIIITHGFLMKSPVMGFIGYHLKKKGYNVHFFNYRSLYFDRERTLNRLKEMCEDLDNIYFVAHSMGGLVIREFIQENPSDKYKAFVSLGTPHKSSHLARLVSETELNNLLGINSHSGLISDLKDYIGTPPLGSIAGNKSKGALSFYSKIVGNELLEENDGTVLVSETKDVNFKDHIILPLSHTKLVYSKKIIQQIDYFFKHFKFKRK